MKTPRLAAPLALSTAMLAIPFVSNAEPHISYAGGDGSSIEKAVIIKGAKEEMSGVHAEYEWLAKHFPGYQRKQQELISQKGHSYDLLHFVAADGKEHDVYFDITGFFGK